MNDGVFFEAIILLCMLWVVFFRAGTFVRVYNICYFGAAAYVWNTQGMGATIGFWILWLPSQILLGFLVEAFSKPAKEQETNNAKEKSKWVLFDSIMDALWKLSLFVFWAIVFGVGLLIYFDAL